MSTQPTEGRIPELTLGWRLKMSLRGMSREQMADALGVDKATITRWMGDRGARPRRAYLSQWALITGVDREWLSTGHVSGNTKPPHSAQSVRVPSAVNLPKVA